MSAEQDLAEAVADAIHRSYIPWAKPLSECKVGVRSIWLDAARAAIEAARSFEAEQVSA